MAAHASAGAEAVVAEEADQVVGGGGGDCESDESDRELVTIIPASGVATSIGVLGDKYAGLEFKSDGTLLGLTGDGAEFPARINVLSKTDATVASFVCDLENTNGPGESFVNANGVFIHFSNIGGDSDFLTEIIDLDDNCAFTEITE
ncbi:MAG: hypothetical protein IH927_09860, partial [Proteobacteria bacterium]|nr:hypothetical protein [Pseudomonadota bacterium]